MGIDKSKLYCDGDTYFMELPNGAWIRTGHTSAETVEVSGPAGSPVVMYPNPGWQDPPQEVLRSFNAALLGFKLGRRRSKAVKKGDRVVSLLSPRLQAKR